MRTSICEPLVEKTVPGTSVGIWMRKSTELGRSFVHRKTKRLFLSEKVDDINFFGKKQNMAPMWKKLMKNVDLDEPHHFLTMLILDALRDFANWHTKLLNNYTKYQLHALMTLISKKGTGIGWRTVISMLTDCLEQRICAEKFISRH